jgi:hypothetical protein
LDFWHLAINRNVYLKASYIPGKLNSVADWASRYFEDASDWKLDTRVFGALVSLFGPRTVDLFASFLN